MVSSLLGGGAVDVSVTTAICDKKTDTELETRIFKVSLILLKLVYSKTFLFATLYETVSETGIN
jgi:hypothetical protein